jgi:hypothetical protein
MAPVLLSLIVILCLLISIVKYTLALILKWSVPGAVVKKDYSYQPTVSVLPQMASGKCRRSHKRSRNEQGEEAFRNPRRARYGG